MNCHANKCVECTVQECANHCTSENYCSLDKILVGTHEANPPWISVPTARASERNKITRETEGTAAVPSVSDNVVVRNRKR